MLDRKAGWESGGDSGPAIIPGKPGESLLIGSVRYESLEMPPDGKLKDAEIRVLDAQRLAKQVTRRPQAAARLQAYLKRFTPTRSPALPVAGVRAEVGRAATAPPAARRLLVPSANWEGAKVQSARAR